MRTARLAALAVVLTVAAGCADPGSAEPAPAPDPAPAPAVSTGPVPSPSPSPSVEAAPEPPPAPDLGEGRMVPARLSVPALGLRGLEVVPYRGRTDDGPGTEIQNGGVAASPHGPQGGTGPGGVGNYQVTAHRNTAGGPFATLPELERGARVEVVTRRAVFVYRIVATRETSFRSERSLAQQRAAVPGRPGVEPTRAMITLSTCATQEDHAEGNYWADEFDNPEHRIDKIGVLVSARPRR